MHDLCDELLAAVIARMGLAGEDNLHRPVFVVDDGGQAVEVAEQERAALIGGEAAGEAEGKGFGIEDLVGAGDFAGRGAAALELGAEPLPGERHQALAPPLVRPP